MWLLQCALSALFIIPASIREAEPISFFQKGVPDSFCPIQFCNHTLALLYASLSASPTLTAGSIHLFSPADLLHFSDELVSCGSRPHGGKSVP